MSERSVTAKLKADISNLRSNLREAASLTRNVGVEADKTSKRTSVSFASMTKSVRDNEQSITKLSNVAGGLGLGLAVGVGGVIKTFADFDKGMSAVAATGEDARSNIDALRESAIQLGADSAFSAKQAAAGVENLLKAGVSAADVMGGGLKGSLDLAAAGELDVADAAEIAATAMTQFNLQGSKVPHIADLLAAGAGKAQGDVADLGGALNQSGLVASQFGLSIEETTGTLAAFASAGLVGSDSGTSFKTMLLALANPSKKSAEAMDALGISAYDAQGNFVGIEALADQLKNQLGDLSQQQRDSTLATIFGSDAIRAANVLYQQGGAGIADWTSKVDDQGYAAETAATMLDNLAGDVEKFQGALESAFIKGGSGGNDALRGLTQRATGLVDAIGEIPGPAIEASVGVAAVGSAGLLAVAGIGKLAVGVADTREAFNTLVPAGSKARGVIGGVGKAAGVAGAAFAAFQVGARLLDEDLGVMLPTTARAEGSLLAVAQAGEAGAEKLDRFFQNASGGAAAEGNAFRGSVDGMSSAMNRLFDATKYEKFDNFAYSLAGMDGAAAKARAGFEQMDEALSSIDPKEAGAAFNQIRVAAEKQGVGIEQLLTLFPQYRDGLEAQANELGILNLTNEQYADWMGGKIPGAVKAAQVAAENHVGALYGQKDAAGGAAQAAADLKTAEDQLGKATGDLTKEVDGVVKSFSIFRDGALDAEAASDGFEAALDNLSDSTKANGKSLDDNTEKGRANRGAVRDAISALNDKITADFKANVETKGLTKATDIASEALRKGTGRIKDSAEAAGLSKEEFKKLHGRMALTPDELRTQVNTPGVKTAQDEIKTLEKRVKDLSGKDIDITASFSAKADKAVASLNKNIVSKYGKGGRQIALAGGGPVWGAGTATSDSIDAKLSNGEFVVRASSVDKVGRDRLHHINQTGQVPHYANGGLVERQIRATTDTFGKFKPGSEPFSGQSKMLEDSATDWMKGLTKSYLAALNEASSGSYGTASPGKYGGATFGAEQLRNAAIIASVGSGMGKKAIQIALITAMQESGLRNLNFGDRDSLGLFQQRAPWGSASDRRNPRVSAGMFYHGGQGGQRGLDDIPGWRGMSLGRAAQAVQVSAFPGAYTKWTDEADDILSAMSSSGGNSVGGAVGTGGRKIVRWKGHRFTERFRNSLIEAQKRSGEGFNIMQGGWNAGGVRASGTSHNGDAIDLAWQGDNVIKALRSVKVPAWHRTPAQGFSHHIHGIPLPGAGYPGGSAVWQGQDYLRGGNGLAYGGEVFGPGTGTSDSVWKRLSRGEWVVPAQQAQRLKPLLQDVNKGRVTMRPASATGVQSAAASTPTIVKAGDVIIRDSQFGADERKVAATISARQSDSLAAAGLAVTY